MEGVGLRVLMVAGAAAVVQSGTTTCRVQQLLRVHHIAEVAPRTEVRLGRKAGRQQSKQKP